MQHARGLFDMILFVSVRENFSSQLKASWYRRIAREHAESVVHVKTTSGRKVYRLSIDLAVEDGPDGKPRLQIIERDFCSTDIMFDRVIIQIRGDDVASYTFARPDRVHKERIAS